MLYRFRCSASAYMWLQGSARVLAFDLNVSVCALTYSSCRTTTIACASLSLRSSTGFFSQLLQSSSLGSSSLSSSSSFRMVMMMPGGTTSFTGGQSLSDRVNAARYALAGQGLARVVCKATTEEQLPPKKKHLDYLLQCTHEANVSIPNLANLLIERALGHDASWVVVFKSLATMHHLMCYGNDRFTQYLASAPDVGLLSLSLQWTDRTSATGGAEMAPFVRRYAAYIMARISAFRAVGYDFSKVKRQQPPATPSCPQQSSPAGSAAAAPVIIHLLPLDQVMSITPLVQTQIDSLLAFDARETDLRNAVIRGVFLLLLRDLVRLFACYNDCIIRLLEKFFSITDRRAARNGLSLYVSFTERMERVAVFLRVAESVGVAERGDLPDLARAPASLLNALEAHVYVLEGRDPAEILNRPPPPPPPHQLTAPVVQQAAPPPRPPPAAFNPFLESQQPAQLPHNKGDSGVVASAEVLSPPAAPPVTAAGPDPPQQQQQEAAAAARVSSVVPQPVPAAAAAAPQFNSSNPFA